MSLLNISIHPMRGLVMVDAHGRGPRGEKESVAKMIALPHLGAVIAGRGYSKFLSYCVDWIVHAGCRTFDELLERFSTWLGSVYRKWPRGFWLLRLLGRGPFEPQLIVLVGWSERESRVVCRSFGQTELGGPFATDTIDGAWLAPWFDEFEGRPWPASAQGLADFARDQRAAALAADPSFPIGGRLQVAEVMRKHVTLHSVGELE